MSDQSDKPKPQDDAAAAKGAASKNKPGTRPATRSRKKAAAVSSQPPDTTRESLKKAWDHTTEFAGEQKKKAQETFANVDMEKSAKAAMVAAREAMQTMEKTAEDVSEKLKDFTKRHESETVLGTLAEERHMRVGHLAYLLYALAPVTFISGLFGLILCYLRLGEEAIGETVLRSHFRWLVLTFWIAIGTLIVAAFAAWVFGNIVGGLVLLVAAVWFSYRLVKGWLSLYDGKEITSPNALW